MNLYFVHHSSCLPSRYFFVWKKHDPTKCNSIIMGTRIRRSWIFYCLTMRLWIFVGDQCSICILIILMCSLIFVVCRFCLLVFITSILENTLYYILFFCIITSWWNFYPLLGLSWKAPLSCVLMHSSLSYPSSLSKSLKIATFIEDTFPSKFFRGLQLSYQGVDSIYW